MTPLLTVKSITKQFAATPIVQDVSFEVYPGEIFALLGASGCGKTTTLRLIAGFEKADAGVIAIGERVLEDKKVHIPPESREIGFVFQDYALFPDKNVLENAAFGLSRKMPKKERHANALQTLEKVGIADLHARMPHHLSGGEQQRVALARSLATQPKLLLLDEPFSSLDTGLRQATREEVRGLLKTYGISVVLVTHDQEEALSFAERVAVMNNGIIEQIGTPEDVYRQPKTVYVANFLGKTNIINADIRNCVAETPFGFLEIDYPNATDILLSIRPEHFTIEKNVADTSDKNLGRIIAREFKGHDFTYRVEVDGNPYFVQTDYKRHFQVGDKVILKPIEAVVIENKD
ncbi:MAG: ABC transporter ATP-binding protein [Candidatus Poribacteria bacterium]|nr:ABC transporter ATP-binding protein [Candidatus Poribacteria bacterium]